ncbi:MAG: tRNA pseudouridine(38-40) synthase TruA [Candidatus Binataceae bacterium]
MLVKLTLEYDGTAYCGWQLQAGQDSVQGRIEAALRQIFGSLVRVYGAGRTDAGVHARGQIAAIRLPRDFPLDHLQSALNGILPRDIVILAASAEPDNFDPRRAAHSRVYEYRVLNRAVASAFEFRYACLVRDPLDISAMRSAAEVFVGERDFAAMRTLGSREKTTTRRVIASDWRREDELIIYRVEATSFLRHMVRTMVALMIDAGRGRISAAEIAAILASADRARAPAAAPAGGLYLTEVRY